MRIRGHSLLSGDMGDLRLSIQRRLCDFRRSWLEDFAVHEATTVQCDNAWIFGNSTATTVLKSEVCPSIILELEQKLEAVGRIVLLGKSVQSKA